MSTKDNRSSSDSLSRRARRRERLAEALEATEFDEAAFGKNGGFLYRSRKLAPCRCGAEPVIERSIYTRYPSWIVRCPVCGRRVCTAAPFQEVLENWNAQRYSHDSEMLSARALHPDDDACIRLLTLILREDGE